MRTRDRDLLDQANALGYRVLHEEFFIVKPREYIVEDLGTIYELKVFRRNSTNYWFYAKIK